MTAAFFQIRDKEVLLTKLVSKHKHSFASLNNELKVGYLRDEETSHDEQVISGVTTF